MWFKKKKGVLDLTKYPHRTSPKQAIARQAADDYKDLTIQPSSTFEPADSPLGFLGAMAESSSVSSPKLELEKDFVIKLDNFEYKLESFGKRINSLFDRLEVLEKKIDRLERRQ